MDIDRLAEMNNKKICEETTYMKKKLNFYPLRARHGWDNVGNSNSYKCDTTIIYAFEINYQWYLNPAMF